MGKTVSLKPWPTRINLVDLGWTACLPGPLRPAIRLNALPQSDVENGRQVPNPMGAGHFDAVPMHRRMPEMEGFEATVAMRCKEAEREAAIDMAVLDNVPCRGDGDGLPDRVAGWLETSPSQLEHLKRAVRAAAAPDIARLARGLKSGALNVGALRLGRLLREMEHLAQKGRTNAVAVLSIGVHAEFGRVNTALSALLTAIA